MHGAVGCDSAKAALGFYGLEIFHSFEFWVEGQYTRLNHVHFAVNRTKSPCLTRCVVLIYLTIFTYDVRRCGMWGQYPKADFN